MADSNSQSRHELRPETRNRLNELIRQSLEKQVQSLPNLPPPDQLQSHIDRCTPEFCNHLEDILISGIKDVAKELAGLPLPRPQPQQPPPQPSSRNNIGS